MVTAPVFDVDVPDDELVPDEVEVTGSVVDVEEFVPEFDPVDVVELEPDPLLVFDELPELVPLVVVEPVVVVEPATIT